MIIVLEDEWAENEIGMGKLETSDKRLAQGPSPRKQQNQS